jgi:hypothetical protein
LAKTLAHACELFSRLQIKRAVMIENWPAAIPRPPIYGGLSFSYLNMELFRSFQGWDGTAFVHALKSRLPKIGESVRGDVARFIESCRKEKLPPPPQPETDEAEAA